jgi:hypothetical protein
MGMMFNLAVLSVILVGTTIFLVICWIGREVLFKPLDCNELESLKPKHPDSI